MFTGTHTVSSEQCICNLDGAKWRYIDGFYYIFRAEKENRKSILINNSSLLTAIKQQYRSAYERLQSAVCATLRRLSGGATLQTYAIICRLPEIPEVSAFICIAILTN
ncbi:Hypothetical_protein [Hexamita inflata]|uniref:Hypothetical_protein n=1 Tax=Hexamita inflata TaxID=28002 RepID=A0ABP1GXH9_9EUKA